MASTNKVDDLADQVNKLSSKTSKTTQETSGEAITNSHSVGKDMYVSADNAPHSSLSKAISSVLTEERENEKRKLNLILHNVPESTFQ